MKIKNIYNIIKLILSLLFFLCLAEIPYGYFQFVRFISLLGFSMLAYDAFKNYKYNMVIIYCSLAILFQPIFKIALGRQIWNVVDVIVGIGLLLSLFINIKIIHKKKSYR